MKNLTIHRLTKKKQGQMTGLNLLIYSFKFTHKFFSLLSSISRSQWLHGPRRRSSAARAAEIVVSNPTRGMDVCCECCALSGRGLCDGLIIRPEESYRLWHIVVCDQETSNTRRPKPATGL
jgi:hypothetical protein